MEDYNSIIVSSQIKLCRNLSGFKFPSMLDCEEGTKVLNKIVNCLYKYDNSYKFYKINSLPNLDVNVMKEKGFVSNFLIDSQGFSAVILSEDEKMTIMINEKDHIVLRYNSLGLKLSDSYEKIYKVDSELSSKLDIAYDNILGYLTSDILNVGTGMKASVTMFLPALENTGEIETILSIAESQGIELLKYDEFEEKKYYYTFANKSTIGKTETDYIAMISSFAVSIAEKEIFARKNLFKKVNIETITDKIYRIWGTIINCYKISEKEATNMLCELEFGVVLDIIRIKNIDLLRNLMSDIKPYSLTKISNSTVTVSELDKYRASFINKILTSSRIR